MYTMPKLCIAVRSPEISLLGISLIVIEKKKIKKGSSDVQDVPKKYHQTQP